MEVHPLDRHAVRLGLGLPQAVKERASARFHRRSEPAGIDQRQDLRQVSPVAMLMRVTAPRLVSMFVPMLVRRGRRVCRKGLLVKGVHRVALVARLGNRGKVTAGTRVRERMGVSVRVRVRMRVPRRSAAAWRGTFIYWKLFCLVVRDCGRDPLFGIRPFDRLAVVEDAEPRAGKAGAGALAGLDADAVELEAGDGFGDDGGRHSHVEAGAEEHVPRQAAETVEMQILAAHGPEITMRRARAAKPSVRRRPGSGGRPAARRRAPPLRRGGG